MKLWKIKGRLWEVGKHEREGMNRTVFYASDAFPGASAADALRIHWSHRTHDVAVYSIQPVMVTFPEDTSTGVLDEQMEVYRAEDMEAE